MKDKQHNTQNCCIRMKSDMKNDDARIKYTKSAIRRAFFSLLKKFPIERITVTEICKVAEINRATFYRYYDNQYDLLASLENEMFQEIKKSAYEYRNDIDLLTEIIFLKFSEKKDIWLLLLSDHADLGFLSKIYAFFEEFFAKTKSSKESELRYCFLLHGYTGMFDYWFKNGMKESPKEMGSYVSKFRHDFIKNL